jgi:hypothetical protein
MTDLVQANVTQSNGGGVGIDHQHDCDNEAQLGDPLHVHPTDHPPKSSDIRLQFLPWSGLFLPLREAVQIQVFPNARGKDDRRARPLGQGVRPPPLLRLLPSTNHRNGSMGGFR